MRLNNLCHGLDGIFRSLHEFMPYMHTRMFVRPMGITEDTRAYKGMFEHADIQKGIGTVVWAPRHTVKNGCVLVRHPHTHVCHACTCINTNTHTHTHRHIRTLENTHANRHAHMHMHMHSHIQDTRTLTKNCCVNRVSFRAWWLWVHSFGHVTNSFREGYIQDTPHSTGSH
jgi:hypothetical protein